MMNIKKLTALLLAGSLTCMAPSAVYASDPVSAAEAVLEDSQIWSMISDPDQAVDIILYVKDMIDQQDISDADILSLIDQACSHFGFSLSEEEKNSLVDIIQQVKNMDIDETELRDTVSKVYDKLEELGIGKEEVKGILGTVLDFVKSLF